MRQSNCYPFGTFRFQWTIKLRETTNLSRKRISKDIEKKPTQSVQEKIHIRFEKFSKVCNGAVFEKIKIVYFNVFCVLMNTDDLVIFQQKKLTPCF